MILSDTFNDVILDKNSILQKNPNLSDIDAVCMLYKDYSNIYLSLDPSDPELDLYSLRLKVLDSYIVTHVMFNHGYRYRFISDSGIFQWE